MPPKKEETLEEKIRRIRSKNMPNPPPPAQDENSVARMMQMLQ
jgi:hypothetical protein